MSMKFEGTLNRGLKTCRECDCCHEVRRRRWIDGAWREVVYHQCFGVSEPFDIDPRQMDKPCKEYKDNAVKKQFHSIKELLDLMTEDEKKQLWGKLEI